MPSGRKDSFMLEHIVAVYPNDATAEAAERELRNAGLPANAVRRYRRNCNQDPALADQRVATAEPSGFWAWLLGEETPSTTRRLDSDVFERRAAAGDTVLSVTIADGSQIHRAVEILELHKPIEIDEHTEDEAGASQFAAPGQSDWPSGGNLAAPSGHAKQREEVIPLSAEELEVGKRTIDRGTTRIRRYVVETPAEREVTLHGERVTVERRRPATEAPVGADVFQEHVVETRETEEVPVVQKKAHVAEEVVIHREATERTEKVRDTVRHEEAEVAPAKAHDRG
jgi:uncharacterized protein (TIGR02271 family)